MSESDSRCVEGDGNSAGMCEKTGTALDGPLSSRTSFKLKPIIHSLYAKLELKHFLDRSKL